MIGGNVKVKLIFRKKLSASSYEQQFDAGDVETTHKKHIKILYGIL